MKIIASIIFMTLLGLVFVWYVDNIKACHFAKGVFSYSQYMERSGYGLTPVFWQVREGDYTACYLVGEDLEN